MNTERKAVYSANTATVPDPRETGTVILGLADDTPDSWIKSGAATLARIEKEWPKECRIILAYSGYDNDPRALWQIDVPSQKITALAQAFYEAGLPWARLDENTKAVFAQCADSVRLSQAMDARRQNRKVH